jgi:hypothetical protein
MMTGFRYVSMLPMILPLVAGGHAALFSQTANILVVTGGKSFEREAFHAMFTSFEGVAFDTASKPDVFRAFASEEIVRYDAIVCYHHFPYVDDGKKYGPSTYKHDQEFTVRILDPAHPVTQGMQDFAMYDEVYINYKIHDYVTPLLATDHRESGEYIGWVHRHGNSRIVYLQPGHDHHAYENPHFRRLVRNAIGWVARPEK